MAKVLLIGDICAERQYFVDKIPDIDEVGMVSHVNCLTSSKIINAGRIIAKHHQASLFGAIGQDDNGKKALEDLQKYNIDNSLIYKVNKPTDEVLVFTILEGKSSIILYLSAEEEFDESKLQDISDYEYIYTATSLPLSQLYKLIERAAKNNVKIFLDVPIRHEDFDLTKLQTIECVVPNKHEAELLLKKNIMSTDDALKAVENLKQYTNGHVVITLDKDGCVAFGKDWKNPEHFPLNPVEVVDTTGAGDIFRGILLSEYAKTQDIRQNIQKALEISSTSVKIKGVDNSINFINSL